MTPRTESSGANAPIISVEEARSQGFSAQFVRVLAACLERRAKAYHEYADTLTDRSEVHDLRRQATVNRANASELRRLAMRV